MKKRLLFGRCTEPLFPAKAEISATILHNLGMLQFVSWSCEATKLQRVEKYHKGQVCGTNCRKPQNNATLASG